MRMLPHRHHSLPGLPLLLLLTLGVGAQTAAPPWTSIWMRTPAAPVRSDAARVAELTARRQAVLAAMGKNQVLVLYAAEPRVFANDVDYPYRQENNFWYLTHINQPGGVLVMSPAAQPPVVLYMVKPDPAQESWTGHELTAAEVAGLDGIGEVRDVAGFGKAAEHVPAGDSLLLLKGSAREYPEEMRTRAELAQAAPQMVIGDAAPIFARLREVKSPWEIGLMQQAVDISAEAHMRAQALTEPGRWEYQIRAAMEAVFGMRHADGWGYPPIVASGTNPTTLHYESDQEQIPGEGLMLIDAAAEYGHYSADITRTFPIQGKFTPEQAAIYRIVYDAQQAMIASVKPGSPEFRPIGDQVLISGLEKLGLITTAPGAPDPDEQLRIWYFHGPSHAMGLAVHDVGGLARVPGVIFSMEPGLYFRLHTFAENLPAPADEAEAAEWKVFTEKVEPVYEKYRGIGVRIEDDILVTADGHRVLSAAIPSKLEAVEARWAALHAYIAAHGTAPALLP